MQHSIKVLVAAAATLLPGSFATAQDADAGRLCAKLADSLQRLVCYDRVFQNESVAPAPRALGDELLRKSDKEKAAAGEGTPASLVAVATEVKEIRPNLRRITLDNGQVWEQMESSSLFGVESGDSVRIEKGRMGGYRMSPAGKESGWARVARVK